MLAGLPVKDVDTARDAADRLRARGAGRVVVTLGGQGALARDDGPAALHFPAFPVSAVDTTAAGDAFNGALAVGLAAGGSLEQAIPLAGAAAALACTRRGAQIAARPATKSRTSSARSRGESPSPRRGEGRVRGGFPRRDWPSPAVALSPRGREEGALLREAGAERGDVGEGFLDARAGSGPGPRRARPRRPRARRARPRPWTRSARSGARPRRP